MLMFNISPNEEKQFKYYYENFKSLSNKKFFTGEHATTCFLFPYVFPVDALHCSTQPKRGCRVSLELQF